MAAAARSEFRRLVDSGQNPFELLSDASKTAKAKRGGKKKNHALSTNGVEETVPLLSEIGDIESSSAKESLPFRVVLAKEDLPGTAEAAAKMHALYEKVIGVCKKGQEQAEDALREYNEKPSCKSVFRTVEEVARFCGVTMATAAVFVVTNLPAKFDAANAAIINIIVNNIYLQEMFDDMYADMHHAYEQFKEEGCCKSSCAAFCKAAGKTLLAILSIAGAVGSSVAPLQGMRAKIDALGYEGSLRDFLHACNYINLGINGLLYFYPLYKAAISKLESSDDPQLREATRWILRAFEKAKNTEDPDAQKELLKLIGSLDYENQTTLEASVKAAYATRKETSPVLFAKLERETSDALRYHEGRSWAGFALDAAYYLIPAATSAFVGAGNALALTMATRVGVQYLCGIDVTEWAALILTLPDSYFNVDGVDRGIYRGLDFIQALYYRGYSAYRSRETGGEREEIVRVVSLATSLALSIAMAIRSVSTITAIVESGGVAETDWSTNPVSSLIHLAPEDMQATLTAAFTTGAFFINFKSVHIILHWALEGIRSKIAPTEYDRMMAIFSEFESLVKTLDSGDPTRRRAEFAARMALFHSRGIDGKPGAISLADDGTLIVNTELLPRAEPSGGYGAVAETPTHRASEPADVVPAPAGP